MTVEQLPAVARPDRLCPAVSRHWLALSEIRARSQEHFRTPGFVRHVRERAAVGGKPRRAFIERRMEKRAGNSITRERQEPDIAARRRMAFDECQRACIRRP